MHVCTYHFVKSVAMTAKVISIREQQGKNTLHWQKDLLKVLYKHLLLIIMHHRNIYNSMFKYKTFFFNAVRVQGNSTVLKRP